jgi:hypothetical protein
MASRKFQVLISELPHRSKESPDDERALTHNSLPVFASTSGGKWANFANIGFAVEEAGNREPCPRRILSAAHRLVRSLSGAPSTGGKAREMAAPPPYMGNHPVVPRRRLELVIETHPVYSVHMYKHTCLYQIVQPSRPYHWYQPTPSIKNGAQVHTLSIHGVL